MEFHFGDSMMREGSVIDDERSEMLEVVGLDLDELVYMDEEERREVLEEAGLGLDDF